MSTDTDWLRAFRRYWESKNGAIVLQPCGIQWGKKTGTGESYTVVSCRQERGHRGAHGDETPGGLRGIYPGQQDF